jgi:hypothetical protein
MAGHCATLSTIAGAVETVLFHVLNHFYIVGKWAIENLGWLSPLVVHAQRIIASRRAQRMPSGYPRWVVT